MLVAPDLDAMAVLLRGSPDYRVLRRFVPRRQYAAPAPGVQMKMGLYLDVEATGLDTATAEIIELGLLSFLFDGSGTVYEVAEGRSFFNQPRAPIPEEVTALTGISDADVQGHAIDWTLVGAEIDSMALVIAHHADYDRKLVERYCAAAATKAWACSCAEVPWQDFGCVGAKLVHILESTCGEFYDGHRALDDCRVGVHVLATATLDGRTALSYLLDSARQSTSRVWAIDAPFPVKDSLKQRRYRWADGSGGRQKAWYKDVRPDEVDAECQWLRENAFVFRPRVDAFSAMARYSVRCGA